MAKKKKVRVDLRKNRSKPPRDNAWTRGFQEHGYAEEATIGGERVRAKGELSRKRTIVQTEADATTMPAADEAVCRPGRVLRVHGLFSIVEADDGPLYRCAVRRLLKSLAMDERSVVTTGDRVWFLPVTPDLPAGSARDRPERGGDGADASGSDEPSRDDLPEGVIERVEPRHGVLTRASRRREHVLVANVDQLVIVMSLVEPDLKPHLIDRYIACAQLGELTPVVCLNKADLVEAAMLQPLIGAYCQLGITTFLTSATTGQGLDRLRRILMGRATVFSGQSGVGKSSLLNALQPGLGLRVREVSDVNQKGKHTTTTAQLLKLDFGGYVVDTPGVRQLQLWNVRPEEVEGFFPEFRPFVALCPFPDCTHTHEADCAVKQAVVRRQIAERRYISYLGLFEGFSES
ncbi:MAG: ribosome small subunit-dependent GTPase A [Gemmataceae bacterium]